MNKNLNLNQDEILNYLKDVRKIKVMSPQRERELSEKMKSGILNQEEIEKINQELVEGNLRFVITVAKQYQNQGLDLADLIAEGNYGLMKAIKNFDWHKDLRFISYAVWWIKQSILQSLNENARTIRLPTNVVQDLQKAKKELEKKGGDLDIRFSSLPSMIDLDQDINSEGDSIFDVIKNDNAEMPDDSFNTQDILKTKLLGLLTCLDERERVIVEDYFGLNGTSRTLEDIGEDFNLTKERVRQIKEKSLRKLRNISNDLFEWL